ncbi:MAG: non-heme iron oxygenase ferredoxin subunit [Gammaproteobacteria bacterium]|nr:non-heme iron oxygenase ferredoxin subunit [Gammaproteobacteria bacterium]MCZ6895192.1 non-heme iron oxygenase ferredoxin subunit [Gammaproteobacteria bacterium]
MSDIALFSVDQLKPGAIRQAEIEGRDPIAIYDLDSEYFATDDTCTHGAASLSEGEIDGDEVICPFHLGSYNIRSGEAVAAPCVMTVRTYPERIEDGMLYVEIDI